jgi:ribosomal protein S3AE
MTFLKNVQEQSANKRDQPQILKMAKEFVSRKLEQYRGTLEKILETHAYPEINQKTLEIYSVKAAAIEKYMDVMITGKP